MERKIKFTGELAFAAAILVFLIIIMVDSSGMSEQTKRLPMLVAWITMGVTILEIIISIRKQLKGTAKKKEKISKEEFNKLVCCVLFMFSLVVLWALIGFIAASLIVSITFGWYLGVKNKVGLVITSICVTMGTYGLFDTFLKIPLPTGLLFSKLFG